MAEAWRGLCKTVLQGDALGDGGSVVGKDVRELFINEADIFAQKGAGVGLETIVLGV
jgi:hypothetical protein